MDSPISRSSRGRGRGGFNNSIRSSHLSYSSQHYTPQHQYPYYSPHHFPQMQQMFPPTPAPFMSGQHGPPSAHGRTPYSYMPHPYMPASSMMANPGYCPCCAPGALICPCRLKANNLTTSVGTQTDSNVVVAGKFTKQEFLKKGTDASKFLNVSMKIKIGVDLHFCFNTKERKPYLTSNSKKNGSKNCCFGMITVVICKLSIK